MKKSMLAIVGITLLVLFVACIFGFCDWQAMLSSVIGGVFVLLGTMMAHHYYRKTITEETKEKYERFIEGLCAELDAIMLLYDKTTGRVLIDFSENNILETLTLFPGLQFYVYENNASNMYLVKDDTLRSEIILCYAELRYLFDVLMLHSKECLEFVCLKSEFKSDVESQVSQESQLKTRGERLKTSSKVIVHYHATLVPRVNQLIIKLKGELS